MSEAGAAVRAVLSSAKGAARPFPTEFRRGLAPWAGVVTAGVLLAPMLGKNGEWQGGWDETQTLLKSAATLLGGPLGIAAGCWHGGRERRRGTAELLTSTARGRFARTAVAIAPLALWMAIGYLIALAGSFAATLPYAHEGGPLLSHVTVDMGFLVAITVLGFVIGRLSPWRLTAPVLAGCAYVVIGFPAYIGETDLRLLSPAEGVDATYEPLWWQPLVMLGWVGGLGATALVGYAARRRALTLVPLAVTVLSGTVVAQVGQDMWRHRPTPGIRVCDYSASPFICVNDPERELLPEITAALAGMSARMERIDRGPSAYVGDGVEIGPGESRLPPLFRGVDVVRDKLVDPARYARDTALMLPSLTPCPAAKPGEGGRFREAIEIALNWLAPLESDARAHWPDPKARARFLAMPVTARNAWVNQLIAANRSCDPEKVPKL